MKKFTLMACVALSAAFTWQSVAAALPLLPVRHTAKKEKTSQNMVSILSRAGEIWRPGTIQEFYLDDNSEWIKAGETFMSYNDKGLVTQEKREDEWMENIANFEYDEYGNILARTEMYTDKNSGRVNGSKTEYIYDEVVKNFCIQEKSYNYEEDGTWWESGYSTPIVITRNKAGNVTKVEFISYYNWGERITISYGSDGNASEILFEEIDDHSDNEEWAIVCRYTDIVWDRTDGQILMKDGYLDEMDDLLSGANRIKYAKVTDWSDQTDGYYKSPLVITVNYLDNDGGYDMKGVVDGKEYVTASYRKLDDYGSFTERTTGYDIDFDEDLNEYDIDPYDDTRERRFDAYGLLLYEKEVYYWDGELDEIEETKAKVTYDKTYGYPLEYVEAYSHDGAEFRYDSKTVFSNYSDVSGIEGIEIDNTDAPVEYYNLQGVRVNSENPAPGIYIRRQGNKATKVYVK